MKTTIEILSSKLNDNCKLVDFKSTGIYLNEDMQVTATQYKVDYIVEGDSSINSTIMAI